jgi:hypothetical protein
LGVGELLALLIVSASQSEQQILAGILGRCEFAPLLFHVKETGGIIRQDQACLVFCDEQLPDRGYTKILAEVERSPWHGIPVVDAAMRCAWGHLT